MTRTRRRRLVTLLAGGAAQFVLWLILRPDEAGAQWTDGTALEVWLGLEALAAVVIGLVAPDRQAVVGTVAVGWLLQVLHFAVLGEHYDSTLWSVGMFLQVVFGVAAAGLALLGRILTRRDRRRLRV